jgi:S1-C subfamily serine protease
MPTMSVGLRALILATLLVHITGSVAGQATGVLRITVTLVDADERPTPVPRHALLVSDDPPTAAPRRVLTSLDGTVEVTLRPGKYVVESDRPMAFNGKAYQWTEMVEVGAGRTVTLELTAGKAAVEAASAETTAAAAPLPNDASFLLPRWKDSVVALWTPTTRASGVLVDRRGLVATSQRGIGAAASVAVQLTPAVKLAARVVAADAVRDVAILWIDGSVAASVQPLVLECAPTAVTVVDGQEIFAIGAPLRGEKDLMSGTVSRIKPRILADFRIGPGGAGGPVFTAAGAVVGITTAIDESEEMREQDVRVVRAADVCEVLRSAEESIRGAAPPSGVSLPVEPLRTVPPAALEDAARRRAALSIPYQMSSADFDIAFITPVLSHAAASRWKQAAGGGRRGTPRSPDDASERIRLLTDFGHWSDYFTDFPPVLLVRVTPKLAEGFWTRVARGAAGTQGVVLPPMKRLTSGFRRLAAFCGTTAVTPIQPFTLAHRVSENNTIHEGLYVFDPAALGPHCGTVRLMLYSDKDPGKADTRVVDPGVLQRIWEDFAPYRALPSPGPG